MQFSRASVVQISLPSEGSGCEFQKSDVRRNTAAELKNFLRAKEKGNFIGGG
jgi:hypothetical protein